MKLKTRIICISSVAFLVAMLLAELVMGMYVYRNNKDEAVFNGYKYSYEVADKVRKNIPSVNDGTIYESYIDYFTKKNENDLFIFVNVDSNDREKVYNATNIEYKQISKLKYKEYVNNTLNQEDEISYVDFNKGSGKYLVYQVDINKQTTLYIIRDITYLKNQMIKLSIIMISATVFIAIAVISVLWVLLGKAFKPLNELNETALTMSEGKYDDRVNIGSKDEVGQLGESFNKMAEAVENRTKSLQESEEKKTIFMGNLTHELKTPMTAISGYAQTLLMAKVGEEDRKEALMYIVDECERLERLSKKMMELLDISNDQKIQWEQIRAKELFEKVSKSCKSILERKNMTLETEEHGEVFVADIDLMSDVIINLVDNGVKASSQGQKIILRANKSAIEIQDFGIGIPLEEQRKILEPFYMVDKSRSRKNGGEGLGLALVSVIAEKYNIKLEIESQPGKGSKFILIFNDAV